jgi:hypothetical protein
MAMKWKFAGVVAGTLAFSALAACNTPPDRAIDTPFARSLNWFGYVGGDDIRAACPAQDRSRIRVVYNGLWEEQVRIYEIFPQTDGTAGLTTRVLADQGVVTNILIDSADSVSGPWNTKRGQRVLTREENRELMDLLLQSLAFGPPRDGLRLPDNDFWLTVASCRNRVWGFQAYHYPSDGFANARFIERLFALDSVQVPVNRPRRLEPAELRRDPLAQPQRDRANRWMLVVGKDGLQPR